MKKELLLKKIGRIFKEKEKLMALTHRKLNKIFKKFSKEDLEDIYSDEPIDLHNFQCDYDYANTICKKPSHKQEEVKE